MLSHVRASVLAARARPDYIEGPSPARAHNAPARPTGSSTLARVNRAGAYDRNAPWSHPALGSFARVVRRRPRRASRLRESPPTHASAEASDEGCTRSSSSGLRVAIRALERSTLPVNVGFRLAVRRSLAFDGRRTGCESGCARGDESLAGVLGVHVRQAEKSARSNARRFEGAPVAVESRAVHACSEVEAAKETSEAVRRKTRSRSGSPGVRSHFAGRAAGRKCRAASSVGRPKPVTRRETGHSRAPVSARGVGRNSRVLFFDKLGLHVLDRRTFAPAPPQGGARQSTLGPGLLALVGACDDGRAFGATLHPRARFEPGPGADALARAAIQWTRRSSGAPVRRS